MLELRPIVLDKQGYILGGNMRFKVLKTIADMTVGEIKHHLSGNVNFERLSAKEKKDIIFQWQQWQEAPTAITVMASDLTLQEVQEFIIRDNVQHGKWDWDMLGNNYYGSSANNSFTVRKSTGCK